ncbi:two-component sensor histidine kinase [Pseudoalteromonas sp. NBT06-2]|nr:ATP-binding protein [Pseudoalteromonas sp. NBT06-2]PAJ75590.1 two-component sensor histidine kinase [Pseudoalteromonas sp. NBT06-2]
MRKLFVSLYLYIIISLFLLSGTMEKLWPHKEGADALMLGAEFSQSLLLLSKSDNGILQLKNHFSAQEIALSDIAFLPHQETKLNNDLPILLFDTKDRAVWYIKLQENKLLKIGPISVVAPVYDSSWPYLIILVFIGLPIGLWSYFVWRDFERLRSMCENMNVPEDMNLGPGIHSILLPITDTLAAMQERIKRLLNSQKELTSSVSHEFRTPLARLKFAIAMMDYKGLNERSQKYINGMNYDIVELESLVTEMLNFAKMDRETPVLNIESVDLAELADNLIEKLSFNAHCAIRLISDDELLYDCDSHFLTRSIQNLIGNAVKYADKLVQVTLVSAQGKVLIKIEDDGPGIEESEWENVFKPFTRLDKSRDKKTGSFGLGLAIVSKIIQWHKGKCYLETAPLGGACFVIELPNISN